MNPQPLPAPDFRSSLASHLHIDNETCPSCGQDIPLEKFEEISGRIALRERDQAQALTTKLRGQYETEKAQADAKANANLEVERRLSAEREAQVRTEAQSAAEALINLKLAEAELSRQELGAAWGKQLEESETARKKAEQAGETLSAQMQQLRQDNAIALEAAKAEAKTRESEIRADANKEAEEAVAVRLLALETTNKESEAALQVRISQAELDKVAAEQKGDALLLQLNELQKSRDAELVKVKEDAATEAARIRQEAKDATAQHAVFVTERLAAQREVLEKAKEDAVNAEKAKAFDENQKLSTKVSELQRALEKKTNEELGEGAEIDLFEALRANFPDDRITRIAKGAPGADILHVIMVRGQECGTIIFDSKNHKAFRNEHVTKLKVDQLAAKADHSILSTHKFPQGTGQLHMQDGVLLANPARVVLLATLLRQHLLQVYTLRLSGIERENKTVALYEFITSERCTQLLSQVEARAGELLEQQETEMKWHQNHWKKQGLAMRAIQKAKADLENEVSSIINPIADENVSREAS